MDTRKTIDDLIKAAKQKAMPNPWAYALGVVQAILDCSDSDVRNEILTHLQEHTKWMK